MSTTMQRIGFQRAVAVVAVALAASTVAAVPADAQVRRVRAQQRAAAPLAPGDDPTEITRLFDAYTVMQAQEALGLDEARFGPFVTRLRALQTVRRRHVRERSALVREMRQLLQGTGNEVALRERLDALARLDAAAQADVAKASAAIDELLDVRQQARFKVLEQQLELRKLELVGRARQRLRNAPPR
jgi:hypothetical protein